ncbi:MAG: hypothetical protein WDO73_00710 [Ignavibacteriota bacterium]
MTSGTIGGGDVLEIATVPENLARGLVDQRQECAALSTRLTFEHPDMARCNDQVRALEAQLGLSSAQPSGAKRQIEQLRWELQRLREAETGLDSNQETLLQAELRQLRDQHQLASRSNLLGDSAKQLRAELTAREAELASLAATDPSSDISQVVRSRQDASRT